MAEGSMTRKWILWVLTIALVAALAGLIFRARKLEKAQSPEEAALKGVQESATTPIRVYSPEELKIVKASVWFNSGVATHQISLRNSGSRPYCRVCFGVSYLDPAGKTLMTRRHVSEDEVTPGSEVKKVEMSIKGMPATATSAEVAIQFAEIGGECGRRSADERR